MKLWKIYYEYISSVKKLSEKKNRTRFDPLLLNSAILLLAKTSHYIYEKIAQVM